MRAGAVATEAFEAVELNLLWAGLAAGWTIEQVSRFSEVRKPSWQCSREAGNMCVRAARTV